MKKCVCCGMENPEVTRTPVGWLCIVCLRIMYRWIRAHRKSLLAEFAKFWPDTGYYTGGET